MPMSTYSHTFCDDFLDRIAPAVKALLPGQFAGIVFCALDLHFPDEILDPTLHAEATDKQAGDNRDDHSGHDVERCNFPTEHAVEQDERDFIDHWRGDEKRERDAQRDSSFDKADEQRHGAA